MIWEDFHGNQRRVSWGELQSLSARAANTAERSRRVARVGGVVRPCDAGDGNDLGGWGDSMSCSMADAGNPPPDLRLPGEAHCFARRTRRSACPATWLRRCCCSMSSWQAPTTGRTARTLQRMTRRSCTTPDGRGCSGGRGGCRFAQPGSARGVVQLRRVIRCSVDGVRPVVGACQKVFIEQQHLLNQVAGHALRLVRRADNELRLGVGDPVADSLVAIEHGHREQNRPELPGAEEDRCRLRRRRGDHRDSVAARHAVSAQHVRRTRG